MRRQARGALDPRRVALRVVARESLWREARQPRGRTGLARRPQRGEGIGPVPRRQQPQHTEVQAVGRRRGRGDAAWCRQRRVGFAQREDRPAERRVHGVRTAAARANTVRLGQQGGGVQVQRRTHALQRLRDAAVPLAREGFNQAPGMDLLRAAGLGKGRDQRLRPAAQQGQRCAPRLEVRSQAGQRMVQPPSPRPPRRPGARGRVIEDEHRQHRPCRHGGDQRGIVGKAKVLAEPQDCGIGHRHDVGAWQASASRSRGTE